MAPPTVKRYTIDGSKWNGQRLELQHDGLPLLWINGNNKYGPWKHPYVTIHSEAMNGQIVAAAKLANPGINRDLKVFLGNPDCTDLNTWPSVKCKGKFAHEYRFSVNGQEFAWRRTRDKQLGALKKGHRDFKLMALSPGPILSTELPQDDFGVEKWILDREIDELDVPLPDEKVLAIYIHDPSWGSSSRKAQINWFERLPWTTELWCLAALMGLQERISHSQRVFYLSSMGYGGVLMPLGNYF